MENNPKLAERAERRGGVWVDWRFQVRHTARMVGIAFALIVVLFAMYMRALDEQAKLMGLSCETVAEVAPSATSGDASAAFGVDLRERVRVEDRNHLLILAAAALGLVFLLTALAIRVTFRVAGPVHAVSSMMQSMAAGDFVSQRRLRRRDEFRALEVAVFAVRDAWQQMAREDTDLVKRLADALRDSPDTEPTVGLTQGRLLAEADALVQERAERFGKE